MMRRLAYLLLLTLCLGVAAPIKATAFTTQSAPIRVGIFDYDEFYGTNAKGEPYGYGYDYLDELAQYGGFKYEYVHGSWSECLTWLETGEIDMLDSAQKSPERQEKFIFSDYSTGTSYGELFVRSDNEDIFYNDFSSMNGIIVGMLEGNSRNDTFMEYARQNDFSVSIKMFKTEAELSASLQNSEVDAIVSSNLRKGKNERTVARFSPTPFFLMFNKENSELKSQIDVVLEKIQVDNPGFNAQLTSEYYSTDDVAPSFTREEREFVSNTPVLRVVYNDTWKPFSSYDPLTESVSGINIDILELIGQKTGLRFQYVRSDSQQQAADMIASGEADLLLGFEATEAKCEELGLKATDSFINVPLCIVGRSAGMEDSSVFAVPESSEEMLWILEGQFPNSAITVLNTAEECYQALHEGRADYTLDNVYTATSIIGSESGRDLLIASVSPIKDYYSIGVKSDAAPLFIKVLNKGIGALSQGEITSVFTKHTIAIKPSTSISELTTKYRVTLNVILAAVLVLLIGIIVWVYYIKKKNKRRLWENMYTDSLTGIGTLNLFEKELSEKLTNNPNTKYVVCKLDIENLKIFNDIYGYEAGDKLLKTLARELGEMVDPELDCYARISADNFIVLKNYAKIEQNRVLLRESEHRIRRAVNKEFNYLLNLKFGMYYIKDNTESVASILEKANYAHSICKTTPAVNKHLYDDADRENAVEEKKIESRMEDALIREQFVLYLQPKYRLSDESLAGAEALVRWSSNDSSELIYPNTFIPLFEKNGFITKLDMYMLVRVCRLIKSWIDEGEEPTTVSINFSRLHLLNPNFTEEICTTVDQYKVPHKYIEIELTESAMFDNEEAMFAVLQSLHEEGFTLSMDDFGTGYSSLGLLKNLPVDVIKIDRSFFLNSRFKTRARAVIENVMQMAKRLEIHTVAEGVESQEHIDMLKEMGCDIVQGYYYSRPVPIDEFKLDKHGHPSSVAYTESRIESNEIGDIELGRIDLGDTTSVYAYRLFQAALRKALSDMYGEGEMIFTMRSIGKLAGGMFARERLDLTLPFSEFLLKIGDEFKELKIGLLFVEQVDLENLDAVVKLTNDLDCSGTVACGQTLCQYDEGFFSGIMREYAQHNYSVTETDCWGTGEKFCRFEIKIK